MCSYDRRRHGIHNLNNPKVIADPARYTSAIRELSPLFFDEVGQVWVCSGYPESSAILSDYRRFSSVRSHSPEALQDRGLVEVAGVGDMVLAQMLFMDPPGHTEIRGAIRDQFLPVKVRERDQAMRDMVAAVLDGLPPDGTIDLVADFAAKLPAELIGNLLGLTGAAERLTRWADAYERLLGSLSTLPDIRDREVIPVLEEAMAEFRDHAVRRMDDPGDDLISALVTGLGGEDGVSDSDREAVLDTVAANCVVLTAGGYQTLTHLITTGLLLLDANPDQQRLLRDDPERADSAIAEFMRIDGSSQYVARHATEDVELCGQQVRTGQTVVVLLAAANMDPRKFTDPERLDIGRQEGRHLGFALGRHYCVGAPYAERLAHWAIRGFLERYPRYAAVSDADAQVWGHHMNTRCRARALVALGEAVPPPRSPDDEPRAVAEQTAGSAPVDSVPDLSVPELTEAELYRQLYDWNDTDVPLGPRLRWHEVFEDRVQVDPEAVAVEYRGVEYSYRDLDERANAQARTLRELGVQPESVVGIVMDRSIEFVTAVLAVGKAGGAFMLADDGCPAERLRTMVEEASVGVLLADERAAGRLAEMDLPVRLVVPDGSRTAARPPVTGVNPGNTAYVVFTSGTTGRPKAIAINHEAVVNLHLGQRRIFRLSPADRVLQFLSPNFDGCVYELVMALLSGARLVVEPAAQLTVGPPLLRVLREREITVVTMTPSVWAALPQDPLPHLRIGAAAGERLSLAVVRRWLAPGRRFLNLYGPAETAVWATWHECDGMSEPPIGHPVPNKRLYVLDEQQRPVPVGTEGELCIGGRGIGRYLGRPELMEDRFRPDGIGGAPGELFYRTGDMCRWRPDGVLEYVGRRDRQTKIRGQRVELDEVERVIESAPGVVASSVVENEGRLEAFVVADSADADEETLRAHLAERLHSGMVPAKLVLVDELPRALSGKVSREIPATAGDPAAQTVERPAVPQLPLRAQRPSAAAKPRVVGFEQESGLVWRVAQFFASCLRLQQYQVKADSDFFSLGGDSIAISELLTAVEQESGVLLDVEELLVKPTPTGIAGYVLTHAKSES